MEADQTLHAMAIELSIDSTQPPPLSLFSAELCSGTSKKPFQEQRICCSWPSLRLFLGCLSSVPSVLFRSPSTRPISVFPRPSLPLFLGRALA